MANSIHCPGCASNMMFDIVSNKLNCTSCGSKWDVEDIPFDPEKIEKDMDEVVCNNCGGTIFKNKYQVTVACPFCGASSIVISDSEGLSGEIIPKYIIPFKITRDEALRNFKAFYKEALFLPKDFDSNVTLEKMTPLYAPFWLFDAEGEINAYGTRYRNAVFYFSKTAFKEDYFSDKTKSLWTLIPLDASNVIEDRVAEAIEPYDYTGIKEFHPGYLAGIYANRYRLTPEELEGRLRNRIEDYLVQGIYRKQRNPYKIDFRNKDIDVNITEQDYAMLPIWFLYYNYKGKKYDFMVNGQTGEVAGELPAVKWKVFLMRALHYVVATLLAMLLTASLAAVMTSLVGNPRAFKSDYIVQTVFLIYCIYVQPLMVPIWGVFLRIAYNKESKLTRNRGVEEKPNSLEYWRKQINKEDKSFYN